MSTIYTLADRSGSEGNVLVRPIRTHDTGHGVTLDVVDRGWVTSHGFGESARMPTTVRSTALRLAVAIVSAEPAAFAQRSAGRSSVGSEGRVLQRSTATVAPESGPNGLHQACDERMRLHRTLLHTVHTQEVT